MRNLFIILLKTVLKIGILVTVSAYLLGVIISLSKIKEIPDKMDASMVSVMVFVIIAIVVWDLFSRIVDFMFTKLMSANYSGLGKTGHITQ